MACKNNWQSENGLLFHLREARKSRRSEEKGEGLYIHIYLYIYWVYNGDGRPGLRKRADDREELTVKGIKEMR